MHIVYRAEVDVAAHLALHRVSVAVEEALKTAICSSSLQDLDVKIRYIPIVMAEAGRKRYLARSRLERKNRIYNCCPQLAIEPFLSGTNNERYAEYMAGLRECGPALAKLGATEEQVTAFDQVLTGALKKLTA